MSSRLHRENRASEETCPIGNVPELAPLHEPPSLYLHRLPRPRSEDYSASRIICDAQSEDQEPFDSISKAEALIMNEVADYLQANHCDDFWRPRNQPPQKVSITATSRPYTSDMTRLSLLPISSLYSSETLNKHLIQHRVAPKTSISCSTRSLCNC